MAVSLTNERDLNRNKMAEEKEVNENDQQKETHEQENILDDIGNETGSEESKELTPEEKIAELNDRFLRLYAEFDNYRKRTNKEKIDLISNANQGVLTDLLPIMDDFERAILNNETAEDIAIVKEGFHLIFNKFRGILEAKGLKAMNAKGESFDSELHEAIANVPAPSENEKGKVIDDVEKGYFLNDKVIRYAKVVVGQ
ncbi:MAG: nucleotide exchange factor GrpE [Flavobacteriia bacterium]|jgi:molecular chaperone GrpE